MRKITISKALGLALLAGLSTAPASSQQQEMPPAQVQVATAETRLMAPQIDVTGTVISLNNSRIATEVEGRLTSIANVGKHVEEGDVIATIDDRLLSVALRQATAALKRLEADMVFREEEVKRFQDLASRDNASQSRLQEVIAQREMVAQDIEDARARVDRAQGDLDRAQIRAPFPGTIVERLANNGEYLNIGANVVRLVDTTHLEVVIPAPIAVMPFLRQGAAVEVTAAAGSHSLPIRTVVPVGDMVSRMVEVRLEASDAGWIIGTPVKVSLPKAEARTSLAVPRDAVVLKSGSMYFFKVTDNNIAERVPADLRNAIGLWVPVDGGVEEGDRVVIRGAERLQPGQAVQIMEP